MDPDEHFEVEVLEWGRLLLVNLEGFLVQGGCWWRLRGFVEGGFGLGFGRLMRCLVGVGGLKMRVELGLVRLLFLCNFRINLH